MWRHAFFKKRECSFFKNDITLEWLHEARKVISFLMNSDWIVYLFCDYFRAGDWFVSTGPCLSSRPDIQTSLEILLEIKNVRPGPTSKGNQTLHFIEIFSDLCACESGTNMSPGDSYFSFIRGWKWLKPVTLDKTLGSNTVKFSVTEVESGFLFLKCFKDGSIILRDPKKCSRFT